MTQAQIDRATKAFLDKGNSITVLPKLDFIADPNTVARQLIEDSVVNSVSRAPFANEGRGYEEVHVYHDNWSTH